MSKSYRRWTGLGLGVILIGTTALSACDTQSNVTPETEAETTPPAATATMEMGKGEGGESSHAIGTLPIEKRVAFMSGHVATGLALYRAGAPAEAAPHLLHPVSETHASERAGIDALGFQADVFEAVSTALEEGRSAAEIEPMLQAAEQNIALIRANAGGDPVDIISYLMDTIVEEYTIGVTDGAITDPGEYQDAFGFALIALDVAKPLTGEAAARTVSELETLVAMWPEGGPLAASTPQPVSEVVAQTSRVHSSLYDLR
ncbi:MAG: hypothetical protein Hens3KO_21540 [Henriciella sp.]